MPKGPFDASQFQPTEFSSNHEKAAFGNTLLLFIESEWKQTLFTEKFYNRLSATFGHIAHYDRATFYCTWFTCDADRLRFLERSLAWPCWGDAEFTFCDVERALQREIRRRNYVAHYELKAAYSLRSSEMAILERVEAKYRPQAIRISDETFEPTTPEDSSATVPEVTVPVQGSLF
jgi:hypothetical protein